MKPNKKTTKDPEREKSMTQKKKNDKPWRLEYMIIDLKKFMDNSFLEKAKPINVWFEDFWEKFVNPEQAIQQLNKQGRSHRFNHNALEPMWDHWKFAGKEFRLVNIETKEIINLEIKEREICQK